MERKWCPKHQRYHYNYICPECSKEIENENLNRIYTSSESKFPKCSENPAHSIYHLGEAWYCGNQACRLYRVLKRTCKYCHQREATIFDGTSPIPEFCCTEHRDLYNKELKQNLETIKDTNIDSQVTSSEDLTKNETPNPEYIQSVKSFAEPSKQLEPLSQNIEPTPNNYVQTTNVPNSNSFNIDIKHETKSKSDNGCLVGTLFVVGAIGTVAGLIYGIVQYFFIGIPKHNFSHFSFAIVAFCIFIISIIIAVKT